MEGKVGFGVEVLAWDSGDQSSVSRLSWVQSLHLSMPLFSILIIAHIMVALRGPDQDRWCQALYVRVIRDRPCPKEFTI